MPLTIKVVKYKNSSPTTNLFCLLERQQGFVGRSPDNDLVLADPEKCISRKHAVIKYEKGCYYLTDTSAAGTILANKNIIIHNNTVKLTDGDQIVIGDYDLVVSIPEEKAIHDFSSLNNINQEDIEHHCTRQTTNKKIDISQNITSGEEGHIVKENNKSLNAEKQIPINFDYSKLLDDFQTDDVECHSDYDFPEIHPPLEDDYKNIKEIEPECIGTIEDVAIRHELVNEQLQEQIDIDQNLSVGIPQPVTPVASESTCQSNEQTARELFDIFLKSAGVKDNALFPPEKIPECMEIVGSVFREMIKGLKVILRGRAEIKNQFRVEMTILGAVNNNPLKFSPNLEDAIILMLLNNRPGFIDATEAVRQGFADLMNHQLATNAGLQASLMALLSKFDPQHFSEKFNEGIVFQKKSKCWDAYCLAYHEIVGNVSNNLFGEEFARVYEEQMNKLKCSGAEKESRLRKEDE